MPYKFNPFTGTFDDSTTGPQGPAGVVAAANSGTALLPGITFATDLNTGIYSPGADQVAISTAGTGRLFVDASGNVGVGATSDVGASKLFIAGNGTAGLTNIVTIRTASANSYGLQIKGNNTNNEWSIQNYYNAALAFGTNNAERMRLTSAGLLGLGTSSPQDLFHVEGATSPTIRLRNSTTGSNASPASTFIDFRGFNQEIRARIEVQDRRASVTGGFLNIGTADSTTTIVNALHIDSSQRVGIGTTSPSSLLHLADAGNITVGTTTGTKIGTATTQKLGFYNATPVVQPTAVADATDAATVITQLNALLAKLRTLGIIAT